jgi:hypothetical protein
VSQKHELLIPEAARRDASSFEILRVWIADQGQHVSLQVGVWKDPAAWGIMLADLAHHVAKSYQEDTGLDPCKSLERIRAVFEAELTSPTDVPSGSIED